MKIIFCCSMGMSSSLFAKILRSEIKTKQLDYKFASIGFYDFDQYIEEADFVLLAPQMSYIYPEIERQCLLMQKPLWMIPHDDYSSRNIANVIRKIEEMLNQ